MENESSFTDEVDYSDRKPPVQLIPYAFCVSDRKGLANKKYLNAYTTSAYPISEKESEYQTFSGSSTSGYSDSFTSDNTASTESTIGEEDDTVSHTNGSTTLSLTGAKLWNRFFETGTEMIVNRNGRRMFPYVEISLRGVDPAGVYDVIFDIIPASKHAFKFLKHKWIPTGRKEKEYHNQPFKHPDSPSMGCNWMTRIISFEKVKLSNKPDTKAGTFTLRTLQMYLVQISLVKHENGHTTSVVHFPLETTAFIAVSAYNNREVADLKINSNPYSKAFRNPVKRFKIHPLAQIPYRPRRDIACFEKQEETEYYQRPLDLSSKNITHKQNESVPSGEFTEKACQTDVTIADLSSWNSFLLSSLKRRFFDTIMPSPFYPSLEIDMADQEEEPTHIKEDRQRPQQDEKYKAYDNPLEESILESDVHLKLFDGH